MERLSPLEEARLEFQPLRPQVLEMIDSLRVAADPDPVFSRDQTRDEAALRGLFPETFDQIPLIFKDEESFMSKPIRVGVVFSGGQAPGGHNVLSGLFDAIKALNQENRLIGFLDGPQGIIDNRSRLLTEQVIAQFRNMGGFDCLGSGRTKIETPEQFQAVEDAVKAQKLDGLVVIGGDDSNTNAAFLAEYFRHRRLPVSVVGVPKTIDGDLKNDLIEISFGFDTATKVYSELIGNIQRDALSAKKYTHFIKLMGRSASHIALECALQTQPNMTLIGEEIAADALSLQELVDEIADMVSDRARLGKDYGVILIPEGIIEFIPDVQAMIQELNSILSEGEFQEEKLSDNSRACFSSLPGLIQEQVLLDRDPHGNVQVAKIETERLLILMVKEALSKRDDFHSPFSPQAHYIGYEGRASLPSNFDANYCHALGEVAALLIDNQATGYMATVYNLTDPVEHWQIAATPITSMLTIEERHGKPKAVIEKALVDLEGEAFLSFDEQRDAWRTEDMYRFPGPIQFFGPQQVTDALTMTLKLESEESSLV
jgi:pyrophosphate--fructose-6-phosphate 1-phosphotransferase